MSKKKVWFLTVVALPISLSTACARKTAPSPEASAIRALLNGRLPPG